MSFECTYASEGTWPGASFASQYLHLLAHAQHGRSIGCDELVGSSIAPSYNTLKLFIGPRIEIHGLDSADMRAHTPVNAGAPNADKDT